MKCNHALNSDMARRTTLSDISKACGVNQSTVSRILNDTVGFSASSAMRQKVKRVAARLGYRPDRVARALVQGYTGVVGILGMWPWIIDEVTIYHPLIRACVERIQAAGLHATMNFPHPNFGKFPTDPFPVDGALVIAPLTLADLADIESTKMPYVSIDGVCGPNGTALLFDDNAAGQLAATHLWSLGHRRIACRMPLDYSHHSVADRLAGIAQVCEPVPVTPSENLDRWLESASALGVTGVICYSSQTASALKAAAVKRGMVIPSDLAIVAFNDDQYAAYADLTVIALPSRELGDLAAGVLIDMLAERPITNALSLQNKLIIRGSTTSVS